jgi:hypothetical protein
MQLNTIAKYLLSAAIVCGIGGYFYWVQSSNTEHEKKTKVNRAAQKEKAAILLKNGPRVTQQTTELGELLTIEIPEKAIGGIVFYKKCYAWNNKVTLTSAMSCEHAGSPSLAGLDE